MEPYRRALIDGSTPFDFDLVRSIEVAEHFGIAKEHATRIIRELDGEQMTRATSGGVPAFRLWAVRNLEAWRRRTPKVRAEAYLRHRAEALDPLAM